MKKYIAIDIGGTKIKYGIIDEHANITEQEEKNSNAHLGGEHLVSLVCDICQNFISMYDIEGVCISTAGMVDSDEGKIIYSGKQIPNYIGVNWKKIIRDKFNLMCEVENDVNCAGLSEYKVGAGKGSKSCVCITVGTGIGACMVEEDKIYHGSNNSAFEVGYMNIGESMYQDIASTTALVNNVKKRLNMIDDIDGKYIFEKAKQGDLICNEEIYNLLLNLASGIANICYVVNPEIVVLGGGIMEQKDFLRPKLEKALKEKMLGYILDRTKFDFAKNGNQAGMLGAYYNFITKNK